MTGTLIFFLVVLCGSLVIWSLSDKSRMLQFPGLVGWTIGLMTMPPLIALQTIEEQLPPGSLSRLSLMVLFCTLMTVVGYLANGRPATAFRWRFSVKRLLIASAVLLVISQIGGFMLGSLPKEMLEGLWSGLPIRYLFFAGRERTPSRLRSCFSR